MEKSRYSVSSKILPDSTCAISVRRKGQILLVAGSLVFSTTSTPVFFNEISLNCMSGLVLLFFYSSSDSVFSFYISSLSKTGKVKFSEWPLPLYLRAWRYFSPVLVKVIKFYFFHVYQYLFLSIMQHTSLFFHSYSGNLPAMLRCQKLNSYNRRFQTEVKSAQILLPLLTTLARCWDLNPQNCLDVSLPRWCKVGKQRGLCTCK